MIAAFIDGKHNKWDANLSTIQFAYNTVPHTRSRISPFYLNHGREATPKHIPKPTDKVLTDSDDSLNYWVKRLSQIDEFRYKVELNLKTYSEKRLEKFNADKTIIVKIKEGTEIYYPNKTLSNKAHINPNSRIPGEQKSNNFICYFYIQREVFLVILQVSW